MSTSDCLFCRIVAGEIPADVIHESERVIAFRDINPQAPTHVLIIPRTHVSTINDMTEDHSQDFAALFHAARLIAQSEGVADVRRSLKCIGQIVRKYRQTSMTLNKPFKCVSNKPLSVLYRRY